MPDSGNKQYNYGDLLLRSVPALSEIYEGELFQMEPQSEIHQRILVTLRNAFNLFRGDRTYRVFCASVPVCPLQRAGDSPETASTVVYPDLFVLRDEGDADRFRDGCFQGAPDLIVEITSQSTAFNDCGRKLLLYEKAGVKEYWIVGPETKNVMVFSLEGDRFSADIRIYSKDDRAEAKVLDDLVIDLHRVFAGL